VLPGGQTTTTTTTLTTTSFEERSNLLSSGNIRVLDRVSHENNLKMEGGRSNGNGCAGDAVAAVNLAAIEEEREQLEADLENIQDHIRFTKEHIDELTIKFAKFKPPPPLFLAEYDEYTTKLHNFSHREEELRELLQDCTMTLVAVRAAASEGGTETEPLSNGQTPPTPNAMQPPPPQAISSIISPTSVILPSSTMAAPPPSLPPPPLLPPPPENTPVSATLRSSIEGGETSDYFSSSASTGSLSTTLSANSSRGGGHSAVPPKSPVRSSVPGIHNIRVHLGDHGHTVVQTKPGVTAREALAKPMKFRKLAPETCAVYRLSDPDKVNTSD
jgi:hypothetical protein